MIFADKFKLDEVLRNLISNALKFSTRNGMVSIRVGFRPCMIALHGSKDVNNSLLMNQSSSSKRRRGSVHDIMSSLVSPLGRHTSLVLRGFRSALLSYRQRKVDTSHQERGMEQSPRVGHDDIEAGVNTRSGDIPASVVTGSHPQPPNSQRGGSRQPTDVLPARVRTPGSVLFDSIKGRESRGNAILDSLIARDSREQGDVTGELIVVVTDMGVGISKENQKLLFQEGMQFDPEKLQTGGGSGFGLYISKSIVELHGGSMEVFSEGDGKGCSFLYRIPMTRQRPESLELTAPTGITAEALNAIGRDVSLNRSSTHSGAPTGPELVALNRSNKENNSTNRHKCAHTLRMARSHGAVAGGGGAGTGSAEGVGIEVGEGVGEGGEIVSSQNRELSPLPSDLDRLLSVRSSESDDKLRHITSSRNIASMLEILEMQSGELAVPSSPHRVISPHTSRSRKGSHHLTGPIEFTPRRHSRDNVLPPIPCPPIASSSPGASPTGSGKRSKKHTSASFSSSMVAGGGPASTPANEVGKEGKEDKVPGDQAQTTKKRSSFKTVLAVIPAGDIDSVNEDSVHVPSIKQISTEGTKSNSSNMFARISTHGLESGKGADVPLTNVTPKSSIHVAVALSSPLTSNQSPTDAASLASPVPSSLASPIVSPRNDGVTPVAREASLRPAKKKDRQLIISGKGTTTGGVGRHYHVLVVDDSAMSR